MPDDLKTCFKCLCALPRTVDYFYAHAYMSDGFLGKCKECTKIDVKVHRAINPKKLREYEITRGARPERKAQQLATMRRMRAKYPEKNRARSILNDRVRRGVVVPGPCARCGTRKKVQGHHTDYAKPLDVTWLCGPCHKAEHV